MSHMDGTLLLLMTTYGILNGLGGVLAKKGFIVGNYSYFSKSFSDAREILKEFILLIKNVVRNKFILTSLALFLGALIFYEISLKYFPISDVKALVNINVVFTIIFGVVLLQEKITAREILGILFALSGIILIGLISEPTTALPNYDNFYWLIIVNSIIIVIGLSLFYKYKWNHERAVPFLTSLGFIIANTANKILLQSINNFDVQLIWVLIQNSELYIFVIAYFVACLIYVIGLSAGARISVLSLLVSVFTTLLALIAGITIFGESFSFEKILGLGLIFIGMGFLYTIRVQKSFWEQSLVQEG